MSAKQHTQQELARQVDSMIRGYIAENGERDDLGFRVAAIPASDKFGWAKKAGTDLEFVDARLNAICEEVALDDEHAAVPRYRLTQR
jgi:hypothetical protein